MWENIALGPGTKLPHILCAGIGPQQLSVVLVLFFSIFISPACNFDGSVYIDGDTFTPNGDPCDSCTCHGGQLTCQHNTCPSVAHCTEGSLRDPEPGTCCPSCDAAFSSGCTSADIGKISRPRPDDPCFLCQCTVSISM